MADVKWIKIVTDIFDDEKIQIIESMPEGDAIALIWFKLLCLAGKTNQRGMLMLTDRMPYTEDMLSTVFRRDIKLVRLALDMFQKLSMVEIIDNAVCIINWEKHQNADGLDKIREQTRLRVQKCREGQKRLSESNATCNATETIGNAPRTKIQNKIENENTEKRPRFSPPSVDDVRGYCEERGNAIDPQAFVDFYASKGWKVGNTPMKDWKAAVRTWEQRNKAEKKWEPALPPDFEG